LGRSAETRLPHPAAVIRGAIRSGSPRGTHRGTRACRHELCELGLMQGKDIEGRLSIVWKKRILSSADRRKPGPTLFRINSEDVWVKPRIRYPYDRPSSPGARAS